MKHLIAKEHHRHLKKRALVELGGLLVLVGISVSQRTLIADSLHAVADSNRHTLGLLFLCYWALLPLTAFSYQLLSSQRIQIRTTALVQLAAAGPGRIIPGGLGHLSFAAVHLSHEGIRLRKAVVITVANNLIGLTTNGIVVTVALLIAPRAWRTIADNISTLYVLFITLGMLAVLVVMVWLSHARNTRRTIRRVNSEWSRLIIYLLGRPFRILGIATIALIIIFGHVIMLLLAGSAVSVTITITDALIALGVGVLLGGALPTPGGIGAVEAGTSTSLIILGYTPEQALATALLFRAVTYWMPLIPGTFAYIYLRRQSLL